MTTLAKLLQPSNVETSMLVTPSGIIKLVNAVQLWNAYAEIVVTLPGSITLANLLQL